jgi:hypothetical protein
MRRVAGPRLAVVCDRLFRLAQHVDPVSGPERGRRFELQIERELAALGVPVRAVPGGIEILGTLPASGMRHQIDAEAWCRDCDVIGEWKSYRSPVPKNDLLLFKAKTDDIYEELVGRRAYHRPVVRLFGMAGDASPEARAYAARHGIVLVERSRWPAPVLGDPLMGWRSSSPTDAELRALRFLARPMQRVYRRTDDGRLVAPKLFDPSVIAAVLDLHDDVSARFDLILRTEEVA